MTTSNAPDRLSDPAIASFKPREKTYKISDGRGLFVQVTPKGQKYFRWSYRLEGKQKLLSMGIWPETSVHAARVERDRMITLLAAGVDPSSVRKAEKAQQIADLNNTYGALTTEWLAKKRYEWSAATWKQTNSRLERDVLPYLAELQISSIKAPLILQTVQRIVDRGAVETARRVLRIIRQTLHFGVITGRLDHNPAAHLVEALPTVKAKSMAAITDPVELGGLLRAIDDYAGEPTVRAALKLAPMVFVRPGELRAAEWAEMDFERKIWQIPGARTKTSDPLIVSLADQALAVLAELKPITGRGRLVFPSTRSSERPISDNSLNAALRRMGYAKDEATAHGFRATARTLLDEELGFRYDWIEQQLGHRVRDPNGRAYNRTRHLADRAVMMQKWADYLDTLKATA